MDTRQGLLARRQHVVEQMMGLGSMKRGTLNEQYLRVPQKGQTEPALRGPYYVLSRKEGGKTVSQRIAPERVARVREDLARYGHFVALSREFVDLSEQLGALEGEDPEAVLKKKPKWRSRRTPK
jgi:hypothetical protein